VERRTVSAMTLRERFHAVFHYRERDRIPLVNMGFWPETLERWVAEGGYLPFCDHYVPPDVSLESFLFYIGKAREIWCEGRNLQPAELTL